MTQPVDLLERPVYGMAQIDRVLGLQSGTAKRWIDGYQRQGRHYEPVVRHESTGNDVATWGEFVETRLLSEYRDAGVPLIRLRPAVEMLRRELGTPYPLASARIWLDVSGRELVRRVQDVVSLDKPLQLVIVRTGQQVLDWSPQARDFSESSDWVNSGFGEQICRLRPRASIEEVVIDPLVSFGEPTVQGRGVRTEIIGELFRAGEPVDAIADMYEMTRLQVDAALRYELVRSQAA
ncbi:MAG: DUF433 domain-containing protein [Austwickia sp.]|nr:DUF433 domain-containing protein [Actinomycetota bacterium]MCB1253016.1 DUF433 domain-containing protein [Austwickia sp.]MCO5309321.1 DUF433 domain-containing protein [Austwickia sp.]